MSITKDEFRDSVIASMSRFTDTIDKILTSATPICRAGESTSSDGHIGTQWQVNKNSSKTGIPTVDIKILEKDVSYETLEGIKSLYVDDRWEVELVSKEGEPPFILKFTIPNELQSFFK